MSDTGSQIPISKHYVLKEHSRYGQPRYETYLGLDKYLMEGPSRFSRFSAPSPSDVIELGLNPDSIAMVDFEGGPDFYVTNFYFPYSRRKCPRRQLRIVELELPQELQRESWLAVVIHTKDLRSK